MDFLVRLLSPVLCCAPRKRRKKKKKDSKPTDKPTKDSKSKNIQEPDHIAQNEAENCENSFTESEAESEDFPGLEWDSYEYSVTEPSVKFTPEKANCEIVAAPESGVVSRSWITDYSHETELERSKEQVSCEPIENTASSLIISISDPVSLSDSSKDASPILSTITISSNNPDIAESSENLGFENGLSIKEASYTENGLSETNKEPESDFENKEPSEPIQPVVEPVKEPRMSRRASLFNRENPGHRQTKVRFPDQLVFLDDVKDDDIDAMSTMLRRVSVELDINAIMPSGMTPLHQAVLNGNVLACSLLISHGADTNTPDDDTWTPLHAACSEGHTDIARLLLDNGADRHTTTEDGERAIDLVDPNDFKLISLMLGNQFFNKNNHSDGDDSNDEEPEEQDDVPDDVIKDQSDVIPSNEEVAVEGT